MMDLPTADKEQNAAFVVSLYNLDHSMPTLLSFGIRPRAITSLAAYHAVVQRRSAYMRVFCTPRTRWRGGAICQLEFDGCQGGVSWAECGIKLCT